MTPLFSPSAPWSSRALLLTGLLCLPVAGLILRETLQHQQIDGQIILAKQQLSDHQRMLRLLQDAQERRLRQSRQAAAIPPAIRLMDSIGSVLTPDISLVSVDINASGLDVRLAVNATDLNALLAFSDRLQQLPARVVLENHRASNNNNPGWPLSASLEVHFSAEAHHAP